MSKTLKTLKQYHFDRNDFCNAVYNVFTVNEWVDVDVLCSCNKHFDEFSLFRFEDEFYILHRNSGVLINWYKHTGRTNTCNRSDFTLDDFKVFLVKLREELVWYDEIEDKALKQKLMEEW